MSRIKSRKKVNVNLPILRLYPQQQEIYDAIVSNEKKYVALCCHRRFGKDCLAFTTMITYASMYPGTYFYLAPFRTQVKQIIIEGQMYDGTKFLDLIPDELVKKTLNNKKVKADDLSIELKNGSKIFFKGCDNVDSIVGAGATAVVFTEHALINPLFYKIFRPIVSRVIEETGNGFFLFISTPRGANNHFTKLFQDFILKGLERKTFEELEILKKITEEDMELTNNARETKIKEIESAIQMKKIKSKWLLKWIDAKHSKKWDGKPMLSEEFLAEEKLHMGEDAFGQEYMLDLTTSSAAQWYGRAIKKLTNENRYTRLGYFENEGLSNERYVGYVDPALPVYISFDLGITDSMCLCFFQVDLARKKINYFYFYKNEGMITEHYIEVVKELMRELKIVNYQCILPHDADHYIDRSISVTKYDTAVKRKDIFVKHGMNILIINKSELGVQKTRITTRINTVRNYLSKYCVIDEVNCFMLMQGLSAYKKKYDSKQGVFLDIPLHDWASNIADSFGYSVIFIENYLNFDVKSTPSLRKNNVVNNIAY